MCFTWDNAQNQPISWRKPKDSMVFVIQNLPVLQALKKWTFKTIFQMHSFVIPNKYTECKWNTLKPCLTNTLNANEICWSHASYFLLWLDNSHFQHKLEWYFIRCVLNPTIYINLTHLKKGGEKAYKDTAYMNFLAEPQGHNTMGWKVGLWQGGCCTLLDTIFTKYITTYM